MAVKQGAYLRQQSPWQEICKGTNQPDEQRLRSGSLAQKTGTGDSAGYRCR